VGDALRAELDALGFRTTWVDGTPFRRAGHLVAEHPGSGPKILLELGGGDRREDDEYRGPRPQAFDDWGSRDLGPGTADAGRCAERDPDRAWGGGPAAAAPAGPFPQPRPGDDPGVRGAVGPRRAHGAVPQDRGGHDDDDLLGVRPVPGEGHRWGTISATPRPGPPSKEFYGHGPHGSPCANASKPSSR